MARQVPVLPLQQSISKRQKSSDLINCQWTNSSPVLHISHTHNGSLTHIHTIYFQLLITYADVHFGIPFATKQA